MLHACGQLSIFCYLIAASMFLCLQSCGRVCSLAQTSETNQKMMPTSSHGWDEVFQEEIDQSQEDVMLSQEADECRSETASGSEVEANASACMAGVWWVPLIKQATANYVSPVQTAKIITQQ